MAEPQTTDDQNTDQTQDTPSKEEPEKKEDTSKVEESKKDKDEDKTKTDDQTSDSSSTDGDGDTGSGDDSSGTDESGDGDGSDDSSDSTDSFSGMGDDYSNEEEVTVEDEAQKMVASEEAEKALGVSASLEAIADYMDNHPDLSKYGQFIVYQSVRLSLAGTGTKASKAFPCLLSYEEKGQFELKGPEVRQRARALKANFGL